MKGNGDDQELYGNDEDYKELSAELEEHQNEKVQVWLHDSSSLLGSEVTSSLDSTAESKGNVEMQGQGVVSV
jgi:hypothetical protein